MREGLRPPEASLSSPGLPVVKMHGLGNAYVFVDLLEAGPARAAEAMWPRLARAVSDPRTGVGSDGLILMEPGEHAPVRMRIFNADGSEGEMCGNGIRCLAMYAFQTGRAPAVFDVETGAGVRRVEVVAAPAFGQAVVRVDMGRPHDVGPAGVPLGQALSVAVEGAAVELCPVSVGNPHAVLFVPDVARAPVRELGPKLEHHPAFPGRINVEFVQAVGPRRLQMRVWERGSGETMACGTGACAALVAAAATGRSQRRAEVELPGGVLEVEWAADGRIWMTGPARLVFQGHLDPGWLGPALEEDLP